MNNQGRLIRRAREKILLPELFLKQLLHLCPALFVRFFVVTQADAEFLPDFVCFRNGEAVQRAGVVDELVFPPILIQGILEVLDCLGRNECVIRSVANQDGGLDGFHLFGSRSDQHTMKAGDRFQIGSGKRQLLDG